ncbi:MAG: flavodoxin family protein [Lachnospiraceae bacterium]|nr:flavodoxin family protein [Lachnospiraceae bacterium]
MNILIHDLSDEQFQELFPKANNDIYIISDTETIRHCIGCFGCWIKTPGKCVLKDGYDNMGELLSRSEKLTIISQCFYGCYSPFVKNVLDRSIPWMLPFFKIKNNETHHKRRYQNNIQLAVHFYGDNITIDERETAKKLVKANCTNFYVKNYEILFSNSLDELCKEVTTI